MNASTASGPGPHGSNFRQSELDKFAALANRWWDPKGPQKALHALNPVRLGYVADRTALRGAKVLDVGCGGGLLRARQSVVEGKSVSVRVDLGGRGELKKK